MEVVTDRFGRGGRDPAGVDLNPVVPYVSRRTPIALDDPDSNLAEPDDLNSPNDPDDPDGTSVDSDDPDCDPDEPDMPNDDACTDIACCKRLAAGFAQSFVEFTKKSTFGRRSSSMYSPVLLSSLLCPL